ncbi:MAG: membrane dipeptidase [Oscillospiraceae bacterium]|nr:membrane dipeptidase [Oscillospiraceae bacterium]
MSKIRLFDGHCDTAFMLWQQNQTLLQNTCHVDLVKARAFHAYAQVFAFCSYAGMTDLMPCTQEEYLTIPLSLLREEVERNGDAIGFAANAERIKELNDQGKAAALLSVEGPEVIGCDPERLAQLREQGFCMTTLTWNADNALAGYHSSDRGLTDRGRAFVKAAEENNILIDVSHLSKSSFWDIVDITTNPILASHSNCRAWCDHSRNLTDDQLRAIAETGGTVGLNLYPPFLGENADFDTLQLHLERMLIICGVTHVALGGDLDGCDVLAKGFHDLTGYVGFYEFLKSKGYSDDLLNLIFYDNLYRLF